MWESVCMNCFQSFVAVLFYIFKLFFWHEFFLKFHFQFLCFVSHFNFSHTNLLKNKNKKINTFCLGICWLKNTFLLFNLRLCFKNCMIYVLLSLKVQPIIHTLDRKFIMLRGRDVESLKESCPHDGDNT